MKTAFTFITVLIFSVAMMGQTLSPSVLAATGGFSSNANGSVSYTVGEMTMVQTFSGGGNILTQGFQQPYNLPTGLPEIATAANGDLFLYPNPATDQICYAFQFNSTGQVSFVLCNILGQRVSVINNMNYYGGKVSQITGLSSLAAGSYFLTAFFTDNNTGATSLITRKFEIIR